MRRRDYVLDGLLRERLVVTLKDGQTFRGLFDGGDQNHLAFLDAEYLSGDKVTKVDGQVFLPRANVAYIQKP